MSEAASVSEPLYEYSRGDSPLLISIPHSGTYIPPGIAARMTETALAVPDTDWFVPELYAFARELGIGVLRATHSRYVVDLNRPPDGAPLYPGRRETGVCPIETFDGALIYPPGAEPTRSEIEERLRRYWQPYHRRLALAVEDQVQRHGRCLLWDAHSIRSTIPGLFEGRLPDLNLGTADGRSCSPALADRVEAQLNAQKQFSHIVNGRFKGGYITRQYGNQGAKVDALQMEIAQAAYLVEARVPHFFAVRAQPLISLLRNILTRLL